MSEENKIISSSLLEEEENKINSFLEDIQSIKYEDLNDFHYANKMRDPLRGKCNVNV